MIAIIDFIHASEEDCGAVFGQEKLKEALLYAMEELLFLLHIKAYEEVGINISLNVAELLGVKESIKC